MCALFFILNFIKGITMYAFSRCRTRTVCLLVLLLIAAGRLVFSAPEQQSGVSGSSGHTAASGALQCVSAGGQSGGYSHCRNASLRHFGGFVGGCTLMPALDTDGDGLSNELDSDNDGDTLTDDEERSGSPWLPASVASDRNDPDTDDDGFTDGAEALAGTDPTSTRSALTIVGIQPAASTNMTITWLARHGKTYRLVHYSSLSGPATTSLVSTVTVNDPSAAAPWYETIASGTDFGVVDGNPTSGYYRVVLEP